MTRPSLPHHSHRHPQRRPHSQLGPEITLSTGKTTPEKLLACSVLSVSPSQCRVVSVTVCPRRARISPLIANHFALRRCAVHQRLRSRFHCQSFVYTASSSFPRHWSESTNWPCSRSRDPDPSSTSSRYAEFPSTSAHRNPDRIRREAFQLKRQEDITWLTDAWRGPDWLPADLRDGLSSFGLTEPATRVVATLKEITEWAQEHNVELHSLWGERGALYEAVSRDRLDRAKQSKPRSRPLKPHLTVPLAKGVLGFLREPNRQHQPSPSTDESYGPLTEQEQEDSLSDTEIVAHSPSVSTSPSPDATFTMPEATSNTRMDIDLSTSPVNKRRSSVSSPASSHVSKKQRTVAFDVADFIAKALSTKTMMRSDVMGILGRLLSVQSQDYTMPATIQWIGPLCLERDAIPPPSQLLAFQQDQPVAIAIFTTHPVEHWTFSTLELEKKAVELRLHDCQPSDVRCRLIQSHFERWILTSPQINKLVLTNETCPPLHGDNWGSGLHALSCFERALRNESCSSMIPFVPETEQTHYVDRLDHADSKSLSAEDGQVLSAVQVHKANRELANMSVEEVDKCRTKAKAELADAKKRKEDQDTFLDGLIENIQRQRQKHNQEVQSAQERAENIECVYQGKVSLAEKEQSTVRSVEAGDRVRKLQEELARATAEYDQRQAELEDAANKHDDSMVETGDWQVHLDAMKGLYGHDTEK